MVDLTGGGRMHYVSNLVSSPISILSKLFPHGEGDATLLSMTLGIVTVVCYLLFTWYFPHYLINRQWESGERNLNRT